MCVKCTLCTGVRYFHLQCFQSSCLSITFSPPLAQIRQADSLSQVKPSRRHWWPSPSEPRLPTHTHMHNQPPLHHPYLPSSTPRIPVISPCLLRDFWDHIAYQSGALPPATINSHGRGHTLAQHDTTFSINQSLVLIIYDIFSMIINSSELNYIPDTVQTLSHLWGLWSPAGPIGVSTAHSINPPAPTLQHCFSKSLIGFCLWVLWSLATAWSVLLPPKV